ncbi:TerD family protein [Streptomyces sp. NPDC102406]|uniref:TerD family protein n=1 Tax=Streptomyces sp. NPDC102406 TaxID=3366171 RepID=UPI003807DEE7
MHSVRGRTMTIALAAGSNIVLPVTVCRVTLTSPCYGHRCARRPARAGQQGSQRYRLLLLQSRFAGRVQTKSANHRRGSRRSPCMRGIAHVEMSSPQLGINTGDGHRLRRCSDHLCATATRHQETVAILVEPYRRAGEWKARAVGQGWDTGLAGLASDFGIVVDDPGPSAATPSFTTPAQTEQPSVLVRARPHAPVGKVILAKAGQATISMQGPGRRACRVRIPHPRRFHQPPHRFLKCPPPGACAPPTSAVRPSRLPAPHPRRGSRRGPSTCTSSTGAVGSVDLAVTIGTRGTGGMAYPDHRPHAETGEPPTNNP